MKPFTLLEPKKNQVPILISAPHTGTEIPQDIAVHLHPKFVTVPPDTDWFVHRLYDFAPDLGITLLHANYSRYVIDLNRSATDEPLYNDGRQLTGLIPMKSFSGENLYIKQSPTPHEIERRKREFYCPYHQQIETTLGTLKKQFPNVLLFDAHSIRSFVPTISPAPFPKLILGDQDEKTASEKLIQTAVQCLSKSSFSFSHNAPFKGGYITRHFGKPHQGIHTLQLEMSQDIYMDEIEVKWVPEKAAKIQSLLKTLFEKLILQLRSLK